MKTRLRGFYDDFGLIHWMVILNGHRYVDKTAATIEEAIAIAEAEMQYLLDLVNRKYKYDW